MADAVKLDAETFCTRLKKLYTSWQARVSPLISILAGASHHRWLTPARPGPGLTPGDVGRLAQGGGDEWGVDQRATAVAIFVGAAREEIYYSRATALQLWLFAYELTGGRVYKWQAPPCPGRAPAPSAPRLTRCLGRQTQSCSSPRMPFTCSPARRRVRARPGPLRPSARLGGLPGRGRARRASVHARLARSGLVAVLLRRTAASLLEAATLHVCEPGHGRGRASSATGAQRALAQSAPSPLTLGPDPPTLALQAKLQARRARAARSGAAAGAGGAVPAALRRGADLPRAPEGRRRPRAGRRAAGGRARERRAARARRAAKGARAPAQALGLRPRGSLAAARIGGRRGRARRRAGARGAGPAWCGSGSSWTALGGIEAGSAAWPAVGSGSARSQGRGLARRRARAARSRRRQ